ncbi:hypothetical protein SAMN02910369_00792 [Lachnospiraceae bacterium NE2001]|nr:hypothetical protein SAMN02910369_00792 [Lachnospiraceae bacterium NE2001]
MKEIEEEVVEITEEDAVKYNQAFLKNLMDRKAQADEGIVHLSPEEQAGIEDSIKLLDHGWPARDMPLLKLLEDYRSQLGEDATEGFLNAYNSVMNDTLITIDDRNEKIEKIEAAIKKINPDAFILENIKDAKEREIFEQEVGKDLAFGTATKEYVQKFNKSMSTYMLNAMTQEDFSEMQNTQEYDDISNDEEGFLAKVYGDFDPERRQQHNAIVNSYPVLAVQDKEAFKELKGKMINVANKLDKEIEKNYPGMDEQSQELRRFVSSISSKPIRRAANGYSNHALEYKTPFGLSASQFFVHFDTDPKKSLKKDMAEWNDKYPVFGLVGDAEDQLQNFSDYYSEKDKNGGILSPEKEQLYRQKIYDGMVSMQSKFSKMKSALEDEDTLKKLGTLGVFQEQPFVIHPVCQRGLKALDCSIETYKMGLENGWSLDDTALITTFRILLMIKEVAASYGYIDKFEDFVKRDEPQYASEAEKEYVLKMRDLYEEIKDTKLTSAKQRNQLIDRMNQLVDEGIEKRFFISVDNRTLANGIYHYNQLRAQLYDRNLKILTGKEKAFHTENVALVSEASKDKKEIPAFENRLANLKDRRERLFGGQGVHFKGAEELSLDEVKEAADIYDTLFYSIFSRDAVQAYVLANPGKDALDFFKVGSMPVRDYIGAERMAQLYSMEGGEARLKAEIVRLATDPKVPLGFTTVRQDPLTKEFKETSTYVIFDVANKQRAIEEKPYLKNIDTFANWYKKTSGIDTKNYDMDDWSDLYQLELRKTFERGFIAPERMEEKANLAARADSDIPSSLSLEYVKNFFGANPKYVKEFAGDELGDNSVYSAEQYKLYMTPVSAGQFSNDEFSILGYIVSTVPDVIDGEVYPEVGNELPKEDKVLLQYEKWTTALKDGNSYIVDYMGPAIKSTRNNLSAMISEYEAGTNRRFPEILTKGISNLLCIIKDSKDAKKIDGQFAFNNHILNELFEALDKRPDLKIEITSRLTPEEVKMIGALRVIHEHQVNRCHAIARLDEIQANNIPIEDAEKDALIETIAQFDIVAEKWSDTASKARTRGEFFNGYYDIVSEGNALNFDGMTAQQKLAAQAANRAKLKRFTDGLELPSKVLEDIGNDKIKSANAPKAGQQIRELRAYFDSHFEGFLETRKITDREQRGVYEEDITPEISAAAHKNQKIHEYHISMFRTEVLYRFDEGNVNNVFARYNKIAKEKGWPIQKADKYIGGGFITGEYDTERGRIFAECIFEEIERNPYLLERMLNLTVSIQKIKTPFEKSLDDNVEYPLGETINKLKGKTQNPDDLKMLDNINKHLAERKKEVYDFIEGALSPDKANAIVENTGVISIDQYADGHFGKLDEMYETKNISSSAELEYGLIKNPALVNELKNTPTKMSEEAKAQVVAIVNKIKASGFVDKDSQIEQPVKVYVHDKLLKSKNALVEAVKTGDMNKIRLANAKYEEDHKKMTEIFDMTRQAYGDSIYAPGNVSTLRNNDVPPEFSTDILNESRVNGFYQIACICEKFDITPEQYLDNPAKYVIDYAQKTIQEKGFDSVNKAPGKTGFLYSYNALYQKGNQIRAGETLEKDIGMENPIMMVQRTMDGYLLQETNPEVRTNLERYKLLIVEQLENMIGIEDIREKCIINLDRHKGESRNKKVINQLNEGLKGAFLEGGNIEKWHLPIDYTDPDGRVLPKPTYKDILDRKDKYTDIIASYNQNVNDLKDILKANEKLVKHQVYREPPLLEQCKLIEESMFDYLMAHPEDAMKPEYKELEKAAMNAHKEFGIKNPAVSTAAAKYNNWKKDFVAEHNSLYSQAKERDNAVNKDIALFRKREDAAGMNKVIDFRMKELAREFRLHRITENYFSNRVESLLKLKNDPKAEIEKPPVFFDQANPERFRSDMNIMSNRVLNKENENYLDTFEKFKKKIIKEKDLSLTDVDEISNEDWWSMYESKLIGSGIADRPLPYGFKEQEIKLENGRYEYSGIINEFDLGSNGEVEKVEKVAKRKTFRERKTELREALMAGEGDLLGLIAKTVGSEVYERLKGKLPNGVNEEVFSRRIGNNPIFKKVVEPLMDALNGKAYENVREKTVDNIIKMIDDKKIVTACDKEQTKGNGVKYIKEEFTKEMQNSMRPKANVMM